jgi:uncharacterized membrane protein YphA (DoxX/SURF4 family)
LPENKNSARMVARAPRNPTMLIMPRSGGPLSEVIILMRSVVAIAFILSAVWKLSHRAAFDAVVAGNSWRILRRAPRSTLGPAVALLEILIGIGMLVAFMPWITITAAVLFLVIFSIFLLRANSLANGCGCWNPARHGRAQAAPYIVRNGLLICLAIAGAAPAHGPGIALRVGVVGVALLPAFLLMEIPTVLDLVRTVPRPAVVQAGESS